MNDNKIQIIKDDKIGVRTPFLAKLNNGKHILVLPIFIFT